MTTGESSAAQPTPSYLRLGVAELRERAGRAVTGLAECRYCPRDCGTNRLIDRCAACRTGRYAVVASHFPHFGEEDCLRGTRGSGTIFFAHCNLRCVFCQNHSISQEVRVPNRPTGSRPHQIAAMMLELQERGCHNINLVTPEHVVPQVLEAVAEAADRGLELPLVYNTSAYDDIESLRLLDGVIDVYMPDFKYWSDEAAGRYLKAPDYPEAARRAIREMHRQVGPLRLDDDGLAVGGLLLRHLVMPGGGEETRAILTWVAEELGPDTWVNLMDQYRPDGKVRRNPRYREIDRPLRGEEYRRAEAVAVELGLRLDRRARAS